jgi:hypothetical protein
MAIGYGESNRKCRIRHFAVGDAVCNDVDCQTLGIANSFVASLAVAENAGKLS